MPRPTSSRAVLRAKAIRSVRCGRRPSRVPRSITWPRRPLASHRSRIVRVSSLLSLTTNRKDAESYVAANRPRFSSTPGKCAAQSRATPVKTALLLVLALLLAPAIGRGWVRGPPTSSPPHLASPPCGRKEHEHAFRILTNGHAGRGATVRGPQDLAPAPAVVPSPAASDRPAGRRSHLPSAVRRSHGGLRRR